MKTIVITGASGGIGRETAKILAEKHRVYDLSRHGEDADGILHIDTDVTSSESLSKAMERIRAREGKVDLLILCAGMGIAGAAEFTSLAAAKRQMDVNFFGAFLAAKQFMPLLRVAKGRILAIGSPAAIFPIPFQSFYSASKAALATFMCALRNEVRGQGITVATVMPGDTKTGFTAARTKEFDGEEFYGGCISPSVAVMERDEEGGMEPYKVARSICRIAEKKHIRPLYTVGFTYQLFVIANKILGTTIVNRLIGILYIKKPRT